MTDFTEPTTRALRALVDLVIPPSREYGIPGAGDEAIFAEILEAASSARGFVEAAMTALDEQAAAHGNADFAELDADARETVATRFRESHDRFCRMVSGLVAQCYYRDPRVMSSLGMAPRPPFPEGYDLARDDDWSSLDPVRARGPIYRPV